MDTSRASWRRIIFLTVAIILAYMLAREGVISWITKVDFTRYDRWMTLPRTVAFLACVAVAHFHGGLRQWGWHRKLTARGAVLLGLFSAAFIAYYKSGPQMVSFTPPELLEAWARTIPVALFEEACFRGLLFLLLRARFGALTAAVISSLAFACYHWHAQPFYEWPMIFTYGVVTCGALELGTGLVWLALTHEILDSLWFHLGSSAGLLYPEYAVAAFVFFSLAVGLTLWWNRKSAAKTG